MAQFTPSLVIVQKGLLRIPICCKTKGSENAAQSTTILILHKSSTKII